MRKRVEERLKSLKSGEKDDVITFEQTGIDHLLLSEKLYPHLLEIDRAANERLVLLMPPMIQAAGIYGAAQSHRPNAVGRFNEYG